MANPFQDDIAKRINRTTGVTGGRQYSTPLPADKIPKPSTSLVPTGQGSIPPVREGVSVKDGFFRQAKPNFTTAPNYKGTIPPNRSLAPAPQIDPYTGDPIKPAFQDARNFAKGVGRNVGNFSKGMGNQVKSALKGAVADPTFLYGMADSANQTALEQNIEQGDLGISDAARLMFSGASRFPRMIAEQASGQTLTPAAQEAGQSVDPENESGDYAISRDYSKLGEGGRRDNLSAKSMGFLGNINGSPSGDTPDITEYSIGVGVTDDYQHIPGLNPAPAPLTLPGHKYIDVPSVVPGLTPDEIRNIQNGEITDSIYDKAVNNASDRQWSGKPVFARNQDIVSPLEQNQSSKQDNDKTQQDYTQSDAGLPYRQGEGGRIEFTNPNGTGSGTMDFGSPEANARMAAKFKDGKGSASFTDLSGMGSSPYRDQQPAPQQQGMVPQYIMPRVPDNSEYINGLMQQLARPARSGRFTDMIADKKNRENLKASLNAALGLQKEQSNTAMNQARLAADQQQFNAQMAMAQSKEERDAIQQDWNNYMETMKFGSGIMKDSAAAQAATEQQNYNRFKDSRDYGLRERKENKSQSSNVDTNAAQALAKIYSNDEQEAAKATDYLTKYYPQVYAKYVKQGY